MQVRPLESLTKEELIELIKQEREVFQAFGGCDEPTPTPTQIAHWLADHEAQLSKLDLEVAGVPDQYELEYYSGDTLGWRIITGPDPLALILEEMK